MWLGDLNPSAAVFRRPIGGEKEVEDDSGVGDKLLSCCTKEVLLPYALRTGLHCRRLVLRLSVLVLVLLRRESDDDLPGKAFLPPDKRRSRGSGLSSALISSRQVSLSCFRFIPS